MILLGGIHIPYYDLIEGTIAVTSLTLYTVRRRRVKSGMKQFAKANDYKFLGKKLPEGFLFRGTGLYEADIVDVIQGSLRGLDIVVFTGLISIKDGKQIITRSQTVVAFPNSKGLGSRQIPPTGDTKLYFEVAGDWFVIYVRDTLIPSEQLDEWCEKMYALKQGLLLKVKA